MRIRFIVCTIGVLALSVGTVSAQSSEPPVSGPADVYQGCEDVTLPAAQTNRGSPADVVRERVQGDLEVKTETRTRILQGQPLDAVEAESAANKSCWSRLDGVWRDDSVIGLDRSVEPEAWEGATRSMRTLAHGTYTTPQYIMVANGTDTERRIELSDALNPSRRASFVSKDGVALSDVLMRGGKRKAYQATAENSFGKTLFLDVSRSGFIRLRIDNKIFKRPSLGGGEDRTPNQYNMDDIFLIQSNLDNMVASRKGYDITAQDPFYILHNDHAEIFEEVYGANYRILEKRTVPVGLNFVPEVQQGMVYTRKASTSERDIQDRNRWSYGAKARIGKADPLKVNPSLSVGADFVEETASSMRSKGMSSQAVGYSRSKQYALVLDYPYAQLSKEFIDAIEDARRYGDDDSNMYRNIITKFGTHYPYAVTYGANAKMTLSYSERETYNRQQTFNSEGVQVEAEMIYASVSGYAENQREHGSGSGSGSSDELATFEAVGGNGSWDEKGYAAGQTLYPILLDLRPLDELLNPINFPGEPEIYGKVRAELAQRIEDWMALKASGISKWPIVDSTLNGQYASDEFPGLIFNFKRYDYTYSALTFSTPKNGNFRDYVRSRIASGDYYALVLEGLAEERDDVGIPLDAEGNVDFDVIYDKTADSVAEKDRPIFYLTKREDGNYGQVLFGPFGDERADAIRAFFDDPTVRKKRPPKDGLPARWDVWDFWTITGRYSPESTWKTHEDGSISVVPTPKAQESAVKHGRELKTFTLQRWEPPLETALAPEPEAKPQAAPAMFKVAQ